MEQKWWIQEIQQQINFQNIAKLLDFCRFFQRKSVLVQNRKFSLIKRRPLQLFHLVKEAKPNKYDISNFWLVKILTTFSKIYERVKNQLLHDIEYDFSPQAPAYMKKLQFTACHKPFN